GPPRGRPRGPPASSAWGGPGLAGGFGPFRGLLRFSHTPAAPLPRLIDPLHQLARQWRPHDPGTWGLVIHDWSLLSYPTHRRKTDQAKVNNGRGYELTTVLLVEGGAGQPVAPLALRLRPAPRVFRPRRAAPRAPAGP